MAISENLKNLKSAIPSNVKIIAVSKFKSNEEVMEAYHAGQRAFGENLVQELVRKHESLPKDIEWHLIGHLQTNKVKYIAPFVSLIHSVDSMKLLREINNRAAQQKRIIECLLQIYIAKEETKFGLSVDEAESLLKSGDLKNLNNVKIAGLMGMATNIDDQKITDGEKITRDEFRSLKVFFEMMKSIITENIRMQFLSMGMSSDYKIAIEEGSNLIRVGTVIFGERQNV